MKINADTVSKRPNYSVVETRRLSLDHARWSWKYSLEQARIHVEGRPQLLGGRGTTVISTQPVVSAYDDPYSHRERNSKVEYGISQCRRGLGRW